MLFGFTNTKISNNCKILSHNNLSLLGGKSAHYFFKLDRTQTLIAFVSGGDPAMINQNHVILLYFGNMGDTGADNSRRKTYWTLFSINGFNSSERFQISHYCETENVHRR